MKTTKHIFLNDVFGIPPKTLDLVLNYNGFTMVRTYSKYKDRD